MKKLQEFKAHSDEITDVVWHPTKDSVYFTTAKDKSLKMWDAQAAAKSQPVPLNSEKTKEENLNLAVSPDGNFLGVSNVKEELSFYDVRMWKLYKQIKYKVNVNSFTWDRGLGRLLFVGDQNGSVSIFNGETFSDRPLHVLTECHHGHCYNVAVDPLANRYFITAGQDSMITAWDMRDFLPLRSISNNNYKAMQVSLNHDGSLIAGLFEDEVKTDSANSAATSVGGKGEIKK